MSAGAQLSGSGPGSVGFLAVGPGGLEIKGQTAQLSAREANQKLEIEVPLTELKTGIELRDRHLRDYMHVDQHPSAKLVIERAALTFPNDNAVSQGSAQGLLWLNGTQQRSPLPIRPSAAARSIECRRSPRSTFAIMASRCLAT